MSAAEYRAPSGALVFASGTMEWASASTMKKPVIDQMTYNVLSEMEVQPATPAEDIKVDAGGAAATAVAVVHGHAEHRVHRPERDLQRLGLDRSLTRRSPTTSGTSTTAERSATDTGTTPTLTYTFTQPGTYKVILKVTDSQRPDRKRPSARSTSPTQPPPSSRASMNPVGAGQLDTLSAVGSSSAEGGTIADYKWDLNGNGNYETDTGTTPTITKTFSTPGSTTVGVQVTDSQGATATATLPVTVLGEGVSSYNNAVEAVPSLLHYYPFDEASGSAIVDSKGIEQRHGLRSDARRARRGQRRPPKPPSNSPATATRSRVSPERTVRSRWNSLVRARSPSSSG